jgi:hypothetical protein
LRSRCASADDSSEVVVAGEVAAVRALHLDHPGTEIGEIPGGQWGCDRLLDGDDGDALERERRPREYSTSKSGNG